MSVRAFVTLKQSGRFSDIIFSHFSSGQIFDHIRDWWDARKSLGLTLLMSEAFSDLSTKIQDADKFSNHFVVRYGIHKNPCMTNQEFFRHARNQFGRQNIIIDLDKKVMLIDDMLSVGESPFHGMNLDEFLIMCNNPHENTL